jgi:hypothetical protein
MAAGVRACSGSRSPPGKKGSRWLSEAKASGMPRARASCTGSSPRSRGEPRRPSRAPGRRLSCRYRLVGGSSPGPGPRRPPRPAARRARPRRSPRARSSGRTPCARQSRAPAPGAPRGAGWPRAGPGARRCGSPAAGRSARPGRRRAAAARPARRGRRTGRRPRPRRPSVRAMVCPRASSASSSIFSSEVTMSSTRPAHSRRSACSTRQASGPVGSDQSQ